MLETHAEVLQHGRARILVDPVPEPHELASRSADRRAGLSRGADFLSIITTSSFAPPCSGPFSAPIEGGHYGIRVGQVEAVTMPAKVEAFMVCSACRIRQMPKTSLHSGCGTVSVSI